MRNKDAFLTDSEMKLRKYSVDAFVCLFAPLLGYGLNRALVALWAACLIAGGVVLALKYWLMKPEVRRKVAVSEIITTVCLTLFVFADIPFLPAAVKALIASLCVIAFLSVYFKLLYSGKLA